MNNFKVVSALLLVIACYFFLGASKQENSIFKEGGILKTGIKNNLYDSIVHPNVLLTPDRLAIIRKEILEKKNWRKEIYEKHTKTNANRWLHQPITIPKTGGWIHDYFCVDGSMLEVPQDQQFDSSAPSICPIDGRTYMNDKIRAARRSFVHYWLCQAVRDLSLAYAIEGEEIYAKKAIEILTKYANVYSKQRILRQTLEEAVCLIPLAEGYDLLYNVMTSEEQFYIRDSLLWPGAELLTKAGFGGNWGSWHLSAIGVIGYATKNQHFIDFATQKFKIQITDQLGDDGLWPESVSTYHFYPLDGFLAFVEAAYNNGNDLWNWTAKPSGKGIKKMFTAPLRYAYPNMRLAAINDGWYDAYLPQDQYTMAYYRYELPEFAWAVKQIQERNKSGIPGDMFDQHYRNLLYGEPLPTDLPEPLFTSIDFPVLGIAVLRQGSNISANKEMMMTFDYGPFLGHGQPDKMGVTLFANGKLWASDYGTTGYGSEGDRFLKSTPSHNTLVIDGKDQPKTHDRNLIAFTSTPFLQLASARTKEIIPGSNWTRTVLLTDVDASYALIWDHIEGEKEHQYDWFFHADGESLSIKEGSNTISSQNAVDFPYQYIFDVREYALGKDVGIAEWLSKEGKMSLWFFQNDQEQNIFSSMMPTADEARQVPLLTLRQKAKDADFIAVIKIHNFDDKDSNINDVYFSKESDGGFKVSVIQGKEKDMIFLKRSEILYKKGDKKPVRVHLPVDD